MIFEIAFACKTLANLASGYYFSHDIQHVATTAAAQQRRQRGCTEIALCNRSAILCNWQKFGATVCKRQFFRAAPPGQNKFLGWRCPCDVEEEGRRLTSCQT